MEILDANIENISEEEKAQVLERFMKEHFPFKEMQQAGLFTKEMKGDYKAQAEKMCKFFGYETIFEYGATEINCHISYTGKRPANEGFITAIPSIYES